MREYVKTLDADLTACKALAESVTPGEVQVKLGAILLAEIAGARAKGMTLTVQPGVELRTRVVSEDGDEVVEIRLGEGDWASVVRLTEP